MIKQGASHRSFDNLSKIYWLVEYIVFGNILEQTRKSSHRVFESLPQARVLALGDGDGRFSCDTLNRFANIHIDSLDSSKGMINTATDRIHRSDSNLLNRYKPIVADALSHKYPIDSYDIVVSQFFLDCFTDDQVKELVARLSLTLKPGGYLCYADFAYPNRQPMKSISKIVLPTLYRFFRLTAGLSTNHLPQVNLSDSLDLLEREVWLQGFIVSETWQKRTDRAIT